LYLKLIILLLESNSITEAYRQKSIAVPDAYARFQAVNFFLGKIELLDGFQKEKGVFTVKPPSIHL
jgi:hypothetical protein